MEQLRLEVGRELRQGRVSVAVGATFQVCVKELVSVDVPRCSVKEYTSSIGYLVRCAAVGHPRGIILFAAGGRKLVLSTFLFAAARSDLHGVLTGARARS
jgi:hypothetical protein